MENKWDWEGCNLLSPGIRILWKKTDMNNISTAVMVVPPIVDIKRLASQEVVRRWTLLQVENPIKEFDLSPGDQIYFEAVEPKRGFVTVTNEGRLERFNGQSDAFGVVHRFIGRSIQ